MSLHRDVITKVSDLPLPAAKPGRESYNKLDIMDPNKSLSKVTLMMSMRETHNVWMQLMLFGESGQMQMRLTPLQLA